LFSNEENGFAEISGNTLLVYFYLLRKRQSCGVREIQRALGFSSSSTAHYHLEKLIHKGILSKDLYGNYKVNKNKKVDLANPFLVVHHFIFPKQLVYAAITSVMCIFFVAMFWNSITLTAILALLPGVLASGIFWYDTARIWSRLPSFKRHRSEISGECSNV
jgi:hypothetical protein